MEQDFNPEHFKKPCPRVDCRKKCCCGLKYVEVPAALTSEIVPENGAFSNAIVKYESTGEVWIFSTEGVPIKIKEGE